MIPHEIEVHSRQYKILLRAKNRGQQDENIAIRMKEIEEIMKQAGYVYNVELARFVEVSHDR